MGKPLYKKRDGISVNLFTFPLLIITIIVHIVIIGLIIDINNTSNQLSDLMKRSGEYSIDATSMQASNTVLSETSNTFVQSANATTQNANYGPLVQYAIEINSDRRSPQVLARFQNYDVSEEVLTCIENASFYSEQIFSVQLHAISLVASVCPVPVMPAQLANIPLIDLTQEELDMTNEQRLEKANSLIISSEYAQLRYQVAQNIDNCNRILQEEFTQASNATEKHVTTMRTILWVVIVAIIMILSLAFVMFYQLILKPLRSYARSIEKNKSIDKTVGLLEMKQLAKAFNGLWNTHNQIETMLRTAAENDLLTGLPNRYCMEHDLLENKNDNMPFAVLLFDVNFLKLSNDKLGHLAGDNLLKTSANCIKQCFDVDNSNNCYRIGGDEFVALLSNCSEDYVKERIKLFEEVLKQNNISISVGYSYVERKRNASFVEMMAEADKKMYANKKSIHEELHYTRET